MHTAVLFLSFCGTSTSLFCRGLEVLLYSGLWVSSASVNSGTPRVMDVQAPLARGHLCETRVRCPGLGSPPGWGRGQGASSVTLVSVAGLFSVEVVAVWIQPSTCTGASLCEARQARRKTGEPCAAPSGFCGSEAVWISRGIICSYPLHVFAHVVGICYCGWPKSSF